MLPPSLGKEFEKLFIHYDGPTDGPDTFSGPIGRKIDGDIHKLPVVDFVVVENTDVLDIIDNTSEVSFRDLSTNHQLFLQLVKIVITGQVDERWTGMKEGPVHHARWSGGPQHRQDV